MSPTDCWYTIDKVSCNIDGKLKKYEVGKNNVKMIGYTGGNVPYCDVIFSNRTVKRLFGI
jgi:hypothetical protein